MILNKYLTAGQLVTFTSGEYSDFSTRGTFVALEDVSQEQVSAIAKAISKKAEDSEEKTGWYDGDVHDEFESALIRNGWLLEVRHTEHHIGSYGSLNIP